MSSRSEAITEEARRAVEQLLEAPQDGEVESYQISPEVALAALATANIADLTAKVIDRIQEEDLIFPDADVLVEEAVVALLAGNLLLYGPPGTGKTRLVELLAEVFECELQTETGTPDWSTYDVVGGLRPARGESGTEELRPWLGHVPRAALRCARVIEANLATGAPPQAHWLNIDELSRADIDKAVGPLYTALSGTRPDQRKINLWFEDAPQRANVTLPERFRILGTMNDVDTAFVNQLSQGLQRRFEFVFVGVPTRDQIELELQLVGRQAAKWFGRIYGGIGESDRESHAEAFVEEPRVEAGLALLTQLVGFLRWDDAPRGPRWPVGSAQLADVLRQVAIRAYGDPNGTDLTDAIDRAVLNRLIPQTSALTADQLDAIERYLEQTDFQRSLRGLRHVREPQLTHPV